MIEKPKIGFIGLGIMGQPMAVNLLKAGYPVIAYARNRNKCTDFEHHGGEWRDTPRALGESVAILITCLPDSPEIQEVLFSESGAYRGLSSGSLVIDMSTISPESCQTIVNKLAQKNIHMLDAPVSGGDIGAQKGTLSIMVGGKKTDLERANPIFEVLGKQVIHIGENCTGQLCKSCNQMMVAQLVNAVSETLKYAESANLDLHKVREALLGGYASSRVLEVHALKMINANYEPGFKASLHLKDLNIVAQTGLSNGCQLPATELAHKKIAKLVQNGLGELDNSAIHKL